MNHNKTKKLIRSTAHKTTNDHVHGSVLKAAAKGAAIGATAGTSFSHTNKAPRYIMGRATNSGSITKIGLHAGRAVAGAAIGAAVGAYSQHKKNKSKK